MSKQRNDNDYYRISCVLVSYCDCKRLCKHSGRLNVNKISYSYFIEEIENECYMFT